MRQKTEASKPSAYSVLKDIRRIARKHHSAEDKIRIVLEGLRGEDSIALDLPPGRHCGKPLLQLVKGISGSWKEASGRCHSQSCNQRRSEGFTV